MTGPDEILDFIRTNFRVALASRPLTAETPLFSSGIVDSFGVLELIAFLEARFGVDIDPSRHELGEFDTVSKVVTLIDHLRSSRART